MSVTDIIAEAERMGIVQPESNGSTRASYYITREILKLQQPRQFWHSWRFSLYNTMARVAISPTSSNVILPEDNLVEFLSIIRRSYTFPKLPCLLKKLSDFFNKKHA